MRPYKKAWLASLEALGKLERAQIAELLQREEVDETASNTTEAAS
jgi:hypothetical protein